MIHLFVPPYFQEHSFSFRAFSLVKTEENDSTSKSAVSLVQVVVCPLAFRKQDAWILFHIFVKSFFIIFFKFPFYKFVFFFNFKGRGEIEV